ncbi:transcription factor atoh8 [Salarias fasciatus]|uniref:Protein atonal homolog 8 n=1 Tax=Salarias fasciatus TaxID=181472 RepID=A0A672H0W4_SALFA|nr:protein atonal homolog 8 [Salarias fasciatus]
MKNPLPLDSGWSAAVRQDTVLVSVPGINKKFKRKSREPKRLFTGPDPERMGVLDVDPADDGRLGPAAGSAAAEDGVAPAHSGAIDMRIGINVPDLSSKVSAFGGAPFPEISHWPPSISQPLSNRLKLSLQSTFSLSGGSARSPGHQAFPGQPVDLDLPRASQSSQCHQHTEPPAAPAKDSPRKRVAAGADGVPEVKAIQQTRRLLANARERSRVHTISAAFEALRKQVPCYSYGQKLSKLAILRIACNYILSLAQLAELDYSPDHSSLTFSQCVEQCTRTLQAEGRSKKRKVGRMVEDV